MSWFTRVYQCGDGGWFASRTPDNRSIAAQDAYLWRAMEIIAQEVNFMRAVELAKLTEK